MIDFIKQHYEDISVAITALVTFSSIIVKLTPTTKDDTILAKIIKLLDMFSVVNPKGTKVVKDGD